MERLNFVLPDFTRVIWNSVKLKTLWEPRIKKIGETWEKVERKKESSLQFVSPENLPELAIKVSKDGKVVIPLEKQGVGGNYSSSTIEYKEGERFQYRVAITTPGLIKSWLNAYKSNDSKRIGELLGFPECCIDFFIKVWERDRFVDTTWMMGLGTQWIGINNSEADIARGINLKEINPINNILLRWLGIRYVSHLPCSFTCPFTLEIGLRNREFLIYNFINGEEIASWMDELLSLSIEWSALHGIATVTTPCFKIVTRTDATGEEYLIKIDGTEPKKIHEEKKEIDNWTDNGFTSKEMMEIAHNEIILVGADKIRGHILDLGCGNGELLSHFIGSIHHGVDFSPNKIKKCKELFPSGVFYQGSIFEFKWIAQKYDVVIISVNRLHESDLTSQLVNQLRAVTKYLIIYSYDSNVDVHSMYQTYFQNWEIEAGSNRVILLK